MVVPHFDRPSRRRGGAGTGTPPWTGRRGGNLMSPSASKIAIAVVLLGLPAAAALADGPPKLDVTVSCNGAARGAISVGRDKESCLADERSAQDVLAQSWSKYGAADKIQCIGNVKTGGP